MGCGKLIATGKLSTVWQKGEMKCIADAITHARKRSGSQGLDRCRRHPGWGGVVMIEAGARNTASGPDARRPGVTNALNEACRPHLPRAAIAAGDRPDLPPVRAGARSLPPRCSVTHRLAAGNVPRRLHATGSPSALDSVQTPVSIHRTPAGSTCAPSHPLLRACHHHHHTPGKRACLSPTLPAHTPGSFACPAVHPTSA